MTAQEILTLYNKSILNRTELICYLAAQPNEDVNQLDIPKLMKKQIADLKTVIAEQSNTNGTNHK